MSNELDRTAVVLAAGGERIIPWQTGVLAGLADEGIDLRRARTIVGTSGGSLVAARLALGVDQGEAAERVLANGMPEAPADLLARAAEAVPRLLAIYAEAAGLEREERGRRIGRVALEAKTIAEELHVNAVTGRLPAGDWPTTLRLMAVDAETGRLETLDSSSGISVGRGVAAARALPGVLPVVTARGRRLMDAVVASATNADRAAGNGVERVLVITPAASRPEPGTIDAVLEAGLSRERQALEHTGVTVHVIRADEPARAAMGEQLFGIVDAAAAVEAGRRAGRAALTELLATAG